MKRELVSRDELLEILRRELLKDPENADCGFRRVRERGKPDADGCNWDVDITGSGRPVETCQEASLAVIRRIRARSNLRASSTFPPHP